jgi:tRNA (guanine-N7-)-methyltransferase
MARRALRKLDPALDLSRHYRDVEELPRPFSQGDFFAGQQPLEVEVGSGKGLFLAGAARARPDHNFLGIEVARKYARYAAARLARQQAANAVMFGGDALALFRDWFPEASLAAVHVYFPDPWWKKRHKKRRVLNDEFLRDCHRTLAPGGTLHFWTDVEEYYQSTLELVAATVPFSGPWPVPEQPAEHDLDYRTHFERRTRKNSQPVYRAEFRREA